MKILIYSTFYGLPEFTKLSVKNHLSYSLRHNYDYQPDFRRKPTNRQFSWAKILLGIKYLTSGNYDAIFWMDGDSLFLNQAIKLEDLFNNKKEPIHFSGDDNDIFNGGHILIRNDPMSIQFLEECWQVCNISDNRIVTTHKDADQLFDQPAILAVLGGANPKEPSTWADGFNAINGFPENPYRKIKNFQDHYAPSNPFNCNAARSLICDRWRPYCFVHPQRTMNSYPWFMSEKDFIVHFVGNSKHLMTEWRENFAFYPE